MLFYVQQTKYIAKFEEFEKQIQAYYNLNSVKLSGQLRSLQVGELCVAIYKEDNAWYRAIVKECLKNNEYKVFYFDYGNDDKVNIVNIRRITEQFTEYPALAVKCCLRKVATNPKVENQQVVDLMYKLMAEKCKCRFFSKFDETQWCVDIKTDANGDLVKNLIDLNLVLPDTDVITETIKTSSIGTNTTLNNSVCPSETNKVTSSKRFDDQPALNINDLYEILITNVETVNEFSIQLTKYKEILIGLNGDLKYHYENKYNNSQQIKFEANLPCVYYDDEKKQWCRAKVMQMISTDYIAIKLIDYGQVKCIYKTLIKACDERFLKPHSLVYSAFTLISKDEDTEAKIDILNMRFKENSLNKQFICKILDVNGADKETKYLVNLMKINTNDFVKELAHLEEQKPKPIVDNHNTRTNNYTVKHTYNDSPFPVHTFDEHDNRTNGGQMSKNLNRFPNNYNTGNNYRQINGSGDVKTQPIIKNNAEREFYSPHRRNGTPTISRTQLGQRTSESENFSLATKFDNIESLPPKTLPGSKSSVKAINEDTQEFKQPIEPVQVVQQPVEPVRVVQQPVEPVRVVQQPVEPVRVVQQPVEPVQSFSHSTISIKPVKQLLQEQVEKIEPIKQALKANFPLEEQQQPQNKVQEKLKVDEKPIKNDFQKIMENELGSLSPVPKIAPTVSKLSDEPIAMQKFEQSQVTKITQVPKSSSFQMVDVLKQPNVEYYKPYKVCVTFVDNSNKFYIQLVDMYNKFSKKNEKRLQDISESAPQLECIELNKFCAVKFVDDELWYRAQIVEIDNVQKMATVKFVDFGNKQTSRFCDVKQLSNEFNDSMCALLVNLENIKERVWNNTDITNFEEIALNSEVEWEAYFLNKRNKKIDDLNSTTTFSHTYPVEIDALTKKCLELNLVELIEPDLFSKRILKFNEIYFKNNFSLTENKVYEATINSIENLKSIHLSLDATKPRMNILKASLKACLDKNDLVNLKALQVGVNCLVKTMISKETEIYRATVMNILSETLVLVQLVDYGLKKEVNINDIYYLWSRFYEPCSLNIHCRLPYASNIENCWNENEEKRFLSCFTSDKKVEIKLLTTFEPFLFEFRSTNIDFKFDDIISRLQIQIEEPVIAPNDVYHLSHVDSFEEIYLHSKRLYPQLEKLNKQLENEMLTFNTNKPPNYQSHYKIDGIVLVKSQLNGKFIWKRAQIIEITIDHYNFKFIDYGNSEKISIEDKNERIRPLNQRKYQCLPPFAICCKLKNYENILKNAKSKCQVIEDRHLIPGFQSLISKENNKNNLTLKVNFPNELKSVPLEVDINVLTKEKEIPIGELIIRNMIMKSLNIVKFKCIITHFNSFEDFYIQKSESAPILDAMQCKIDACVEELDDFSPETLCVSVFNLDNQFYRSKILSSDKNHNLARVFYIDFGNTDTVNMNMVTNISPELKQIDKMAFNCKLEFNSDIIQKYKKEFNDFFSEKSAEMEFEFQLIRKQYNDDYTISEPYIVDLIDVVSGKSIKILFLELINSPDTIEYEKNLKDDHTLLVEQSENDFTATTTMMEENEDEDDRAIADATFAQQLMNTLMLENKTLEDEDNNALHSETWTDTPSHVRNLPDAYDPNNETTQIESFLEKYANNDTTMNATQNNATSASMPGLISFNRGQSVLKELISLGRNHPEENELEESNLMYSTANSIVFDNNQVSTSENLCANEHDSEIKDLKVEQPIKSLNATTPETDEFTYKNVIISYLDHFESFYIQFENFDDEMKKMQPIIDGCVQPLENREPGELCIAQYSVDKKYYRAKILEWDEKTAKVLFIDYGNDDNSDVNQITRMCDKLRDIPPLAINCSLDRTVEIQSPEAFDKFEDLFNDNTSFDVKVVRKANEKLIVDLYVSSNGVLVNEKSLLDDSVRSKPVEKLANNLPLKTQEEEKLKELAVVSNSKTTFEDDLDSTEPNGDATISKSKYESTKCDDEEDGNNDFEDEETPSKEIGPLIIDKRLWTDKEGKCMLEKASYLVDDEARENSDICEAYQLDEKEWTEARNYTLEGMPDQSIWTVKKDDTTIQSDSLQNISGSFCIDDTLWTVNNNYTIDYTIEESSTWTANGDKTEESIEEPIINENNHNNNDDVTWMSDPNASIFDMKKRKQERENPPCNYKNECYGFVMNINSLQSFYVQLENADVKLMEMKALLEKCTEKLTQPVKGKLCAARDYVDDQLLRARIVRLDKGRAKILFIDYGNTAKVSLSDLYKMSSELQKVAPLSIHCSLNDVKNDSKLAESVEMIDKFKLLTSKCPVNVKILNETPTMPQVSTHFSPLEVDLFINQINIRYRLNIQPSLTTPTARTLFGNRCETNDFFYGKVVKISSLNNVLVQRKSKLDKIQRVINEYNNMTCVEMDCDDEYCLAPSSNGGDEYLRARVIEKNGDKYKLNYIDYGFEETVNKRDLLKASDIITEISPAIEEYKMHLVTNLDLITETSTAYIIKLFKLFVDSGENEYKICVCGKNQNKKTIRLYDINARNLCLNNLLETSIVLLVTPFFGTVNSIEKDFKEFVCVHIACSARSALIEFEKLFEKYLMKKLNERELISIHSDEPIYKKNDLCLVYNEETLNTSISGTKGVLTRSSSTQSVGSAINQSEIYKQSIYRATVLNYNKSSDNYQFFNVDNGSIDFIKRKHAFKLNEELITDQAVIEIPFMAIKAQSQEDKCDDSLNKIISNSKYFGHKIKLEIIKSVDRLTKIVLVVKDAKLVKEEPKDFINLFKTKPNWYGISLFESFDSFYLQTTQTYHNLDFIENRFKLPSSFSNKTVNKPQLNSCIYALRNSLKVNTVFSRVIVLRQIDDLHCEVVLIDFGLKEIIKMDQLVVITDEVVKRLEPQAIWCKLNNSEEIDNRKQVEIEFKKSFQFKRFKVNFVKEQPNILTQAIVELLTSDSDDSNEFINLKDLLNINQEEDKNSSHLQVQKFQLKKFYDIEIVNIINIDKFYCRLSDWFTKAKAIQNEIITDYKLNKLTSLKERLIKENKEIYHRKNDQLCLILVENQGDYIGFRGKLLNINKDNLAKVYLIDSGTFNDIHVDNLYEFNKSYYQFEKVGFECCLNNVEVLHDEQCKATFEKIVMLNQGKFKMEFVKQLETQKLAVNVFDPNFKADIGKTLIRLKVAKEANENHDASIFNPIVSMDVSEMSCTINQSSTSSSMSLQVTPMLPITKSINGSQNRRHSYTRTRTTSNSINSFSQYQLPEKTKIKMTLLSVQESQNIVLIRNEVKLKREEFISNLNKWYEDRKTKLNKLEYIKIGMPCCVFAFEMINKFSRGLISFINADYCRIYLVDYCDTINVQLSQIYELNENFLKDYCYAHKCYLDSSNDAILFKEIEKIRLQIKKLIISTGPASILYNINFVLNRYEFLVEIIDTKKKPLNIEINQYNDLNLNSFSYLYKIKVLDRKLASSDTTRTDESTMKTCIDETTENILCSTYRDTSNYRNDLNDLTSNVQNCNSASSLPRRFQALLNTTDIAFSTISETITLSNLSTDEDVSVEKTNYELSRLNKLKYRKKLSKCQAKNQTSRWIDEDDDNIELSGEKIESIRLNFIKPMDLVRVRIVPHTFHSYEFFCQQLDLIEEYEQLQEKMDKYYENQELNTDKNLLKYLSIGDYCAAKLNKSWSRCRITDLTNNMALLECIDDGRNLRVHIDKLKLLNIEFKFLPAISFKCKLYDGNATRLLDFGQNTFDKFKNLILEENKFIAEVVVLKEDNGSFFYEINLFNNDNINIFEVLENI